MTIEDQLDLIITLFLKMLRDFTLFTITKKNFIRAWHGHFKEEKFIGCIKGTFQISAVKINNKNKPNKKNRIFSYFLNQSNNDFVYIPKGFANGSMSLEDNSELLIFSTSKVEDSLKDDYRFDPKYWNPWIINER